MIVRLPGGQRQVIAGPTVTYRHMQRVDGTTITPTELDAMLERAARAVADWNTPVNVQRAPARKPPVPKSEQPRYQRHTHCIRGHELEGDNVLHSDAGNGRIKRACKQCRRDLERNRRLLRTHCKRGHALTPGNVLPRKDGVRRCLICHEYANRLRANNWQRAA